MLKIKKRMKKLIFVLLGAFILAACEGPEGPRGPQGQPGTGVNTVTVYDVVFNTDWKPVYDRNGYFLHYEYSLRVPELTFDMLENVLMSAYIDLGDDEAGLYYQLPYIINGEGTDSSLWTRTVDCYFIEGRAVFNVKYTDFYDGLPETMYFKIVLLDTY